jgi:hypothetical protein
MLLRENLIPTVSNGEGFAERSLLRHYSISWKFAVSILSVVSRFLKLSNPTILL